MLGTKTRALMQREQGRDLFDLYHAWHLSEAGTTPYAVDGAKAMDAFAWYLEKAGVKKERTLVPTKPMRHLIRACARMRSGETWTRYYALACQNVL